MHPIIWIYIKREFKGKVLKVSSTQINSNIFNYINSVSIIISLLLLCIVGMTGVLSPITLYLIMLSVGVILIIIISDKNDVYYKVKLFLFFFSLYLIYTLSVHYILLDDSSNILLQLFNDEFTLYELSNMGLPYVTGKKNFFDIFFVYRIDELPLHIVFMSLIANFSIYIDGTNVILTQKLFSPFLGGLFSVFLYSTLKYQFKNTTIAFNGTMVYGLLSAIFMYSTPILRDIDIALTYIMFFYVFLQKNSFVNILTMLLIAFITYFLRNESGIVLFALTIFSLFFSVKELKNIWLKMIIYSVLSVLLLVFFYLSASVILSISEQYSQMAEGRMAMGAAESTKNSFSKIFEKLPFGVSHTLKVFFGQIQPFPLFRAIFKPPEMVSGIFWPFIFMMMLYGIAYKHIREKIDIKIKYLLVASIAILFLMSAEPMTRRMLSIYPIIYIVSLYVFFIVPKNKIKKAAAYYIFGIIVLNTFYYLMKI